jgi:hypothetical protein
MVGVVATTAFEDIADMLGETEQVGDGSYCKCDCGAALADLPPVDRNASISQRK